jgi:guanylate kinase
MGQVAGQIEGCGEFDYVVMNDDLAVAKESLVSIVRAEFARRTVRMTWVDQALRQAAEQMLKDALDSE